MASGGEPSDSMSNMSELTKLIKNQLNKGFMDDLPLSINDMAYQGFDPKFLLSTLFQRGLARGLSKEDIGTHLKTLALIGTMRGSSATKIMRKSTDVLKRFLQDAVITFDIKDGKPISNVTATLPRIAAIFAMAVALKIKNDPTISLTVQPESIHQDFPRCMCISTFGSMIPVEGLPDAVASTLTEAFCYHQYKFDRVIKQRDFASKDVIANFVKVQIMSNLYDSEFRIKALVKFGILKQTGSEYTLSAQHENGLAEAASLWRKAA